MVVNSTVRAGFSVEGGRPRFTWSPRAHSLSARVHVCEGITATARRRICYTAHLRAFGLCSRRHCLLQLGIVLTSELVTEGRRTLIII